MTRDDKGANVGGADDVLTTPVVFLVFNRPDCTARVFAEIRRARPQQLYIVADGPRPDRPEDIQKCAAVRRIIDDGIDWDCEVHREYSACNLACARRVSSGIGWFFGLVEEGIILEDDCLPAPEFFRFCQELLARYRHDERIGQICGTPFIAETVKSAASYVFSRYGPVWGWASWRRAWKSYDLELKNWPQAKQLHLLDTIVLSKQEQRKRVRLYDRLHGGDLHTWDYQWGYAKLTQSMLSVIPAANLIENIGWGRAGTHTTGESSRVLRHRPLVFPLRHPEFISADPAFDAAFSDVFAPAGIRRVFHRLRTLMKTR